ncbi:MAG: hypothetical protein K9L17_00765 [Clostridiales bacterium]|nr:hypothetical protein [Clostridiales bacterium]MCF8021224.1 hypothetical protein [Clostridiales bacterium]
MRKLLILVVIIILAILWFVQKPLPAGIYPQKQAGMVRLNKNKLIEFNLPVFWVKPYPWVDKPSKLKEVKLLNQKGEELAVIDGEYYPSINKNKNHWYKRVAEGEIRLILKSQMHITGERVILRDLDKKPSSYIAGKLIIKTSNDKQSFSMQDTYKFVNLDENKSLDKKWGITITTPLINEQTSKEKGWIVGLSGSSRAALEKIHFWLPGIPENYFRDNVQYCDEQNARKYINKESFNGVSLDLPLKLRPGYPVLIYFPFTEKMEKRINNSLVRFCPVFKIKKQTGEEYLITDNHSVGPLKR